MSRIIFHLDMNSYFASVEQMCNPFLKGKPIAVGGSPGTRTIVVAASVEAKRFGVKTGMSHIEAREKCPHIQFIEGNIALYVDLTRKFASIASQYSDRLEITSVDEMFLDVTDWVLGFPAACALAQKLKERLRKEMGGLTSSVGIAPNRLLAKLASDMIKPDGLVVIEEEDVSKVLEWVELTDIPGIGDRLKIQLADFGIRTLKQLGQTPLSSLQGHFGPVAGLHLWQMGNGIDETPVAYASSKHEDTAKSMGHTYTLPKDTADRQEIYALLLRLSEKLGRRMRKDGYSGRHIWIYLRWSDFSGKGEGITLKEYIEDGYLIYQYAKTLLDGWVFKSPVRLVGVGVTQLKQGGKQNYLLPSNQKGERLLFAQDRINDRYGEFSIQRARIMETHLTKKAGGFLTRKEADFSGE